MQLSDFFEAKTVSKVTLDLMPREDTLGNQIIYGLDNDMEHEALANCDVAIIGVYDGKNSPGNEGCKDASDAIRNCLAGLRKTPRALNIIDLGNVKGKTLDDRYFAIREVTEILSSRGVCCILVGGGQDYVVPVTKGLAKNHKDISLSVFDAKLDIGVNGLDFCSQNFLSQLEIDCNNDIFELNLLGVQKYLIGESQENKLAKLNWQCVRLKDLRGENVCCAEPLLRNADLVSFDVGAIQRDYMPYFSNVNVNGFTGFEACQIAWYAGVNDGLKAFCVHEYNPNLDKTGKGTMLCAEMIWHFLDGISQSMKEVPSESASEYKISVVHLQDFGVDIRFYLNRVNKRRWIEVPWNSGVKVLACDEKDYLLAQSGELSDKWWRFFKNDDK